MDKSTLPATHYRTMMQTYYVKCRMMVEVDSSVQIILNGRSAAKVTCPVCGTFVFQMGKPQWGHARGS